MRALGGWAQRPSSRFVEDETQVKIGWRLNTITLSAQCQLTTHSLVSMTRQPSLCWSWEKTSTYGLRRSVSRTQEAHTFGCDVRRRHGPTNGAKGTQIHVKSRALYSGFEVKVVAEFGCSHDVIIGSQSSG